MVRNINGPMEVQLLKLRQLSWIGEKYHFYSATGREVNVPILIQDPSQIQPKDKQEFILVGIILFVKILFIHEKERERERQRHRQREKQASHREPDVELDPRPQDHNRSQRQALLGSRKNQSVPC